MSIKPWFQAAGHGRLQGLRFADQTKPVYPHELVQSLALYIGQLSFTLTGQ